MLVWYLCTHEVTHIYVIYRQIWWLFPPIKLTPLIIAFVVMISFFPPPTPFFWRKESNLMFNFCWSNFGKCSKNVVSFHPVQSKQFVFERSSFSGWIKPKTSASLSKPCKLCFIIGRHFLLHWLSKCKTLCFKIDFDLTHCNF